MRTRTEIENDALDKWHGEKFDPYMEKGKQHEMILEVLLDIRDLLSKDAKE